jgi:ABC-type Zn uptake system ZnuABC Zn-binding protein ZnuA
MDVRNARVYAQVIRDTLIRADPSRTEQYEENYTAFSRTLDEVAMYVDRQVGSVPARARKLVTTHEGFGYLANSYGLEIAGFVAPSPGQEPSPSDISKLTQIIRSAGVPAVFVEPQLGQQSAVLNQVAADLGIKVCTLYSDALDNKIKTYVDLMRFNADEIARCLAG